jgi:hypothetical protein
MHETRYSLEWLSTGFVREVRDAALLASRIERSGVERLPERLDELERLRRRLRNLNSHIGYHQNWQTEVARHPEFYEQRNRIVALARELHRLSEARQDPARQVELRRRIVEALAPFRPTRSLAIEFRPDGTRELALGLVTDIEDEGFLEGFTRAVHEAFNRSEAALARKFRLDLRLRGIRPSDLYAGEPPAPLARIEAGEHLARFPEGALVLTTGAASTHAYVGRYIQLGPEDASARKLAHEFAHLLGFSDAYLRGHEGNPDDPYGVVLVEWVGLRNDLMGNPGGGEVSEEMIRQLVEAYDERGSSVNRAAAADERRAPSPP